MLTQLRVSQWAPAGFLWLSGVRGKQTTYSHQFLLHTTTRWSAPARSRIDPVIISREIDTKHLDFTLPVHGLIICIFTVCLPRRHHEQFSPWRWNESGEGQRGSTLKLSWEFISGGQDENTVRKNLGETNNTATENNITFLLAIESATKWIYRVGRCVCCWARSSKASRSCKTRVKAATESRWKQAMTDFVANVSAHTCIFTHPAHTERH